MRFRSTETPPHAQSFSFSVCNLKLSHQLSRRGFLLLAPACLLSDKTHAILPAIFGRLMLRAIPRMIRGTRTVSRANTGYQPRISDQRTKINSISRNKSEQVNKNNAPFLLNRELSKNKDLSEKDKNTLVNNTLFVARGISTAKNANHLLSYWEQNDNYYSENRRHLRRCSTCSSIYNTTIQNTSLEFAQISHANAIHRRVCEEYSQYVQFDNGEWDNVWGCACLREDGIWETAPCNVLDHPI